MTLRTALVGLAFALIVAACGGGEDSTSGPLASPTPLQQPELSPTQVLAPASTTTPLPTPDLSPTQVPAFSTATPLPDTGISEVDAVIDALESLDIEMLISLIRPRDVPCRATPPPLASEPTCPPEQVDGSLVEAFYVVSCKGGFVPIDRGVQNTIRLLNEQLPESRVYGVYRVPPLPRTASEVPRYVVVLSFEPERADGFGPFGWTLTLEDGLVGYDYGCARSPEQLIKDNGLTDSLLTPPD